MQIINTLHEIDALDNVAHSYANDDGTWTVYFYGEELPVIPTVNVPSVPETLTMFQFRAALAHYDYLNAIQTFFDSLPDTALPKLAWITNSPVPRSSASVNSIGKTLLELTNSEIDQIFIYGGTISI